MTTTAFDLIAHSDAIHPPWGFLAIFWGAGVVIVVLAVLAWRFGWKRWRQIEFTIFGLLWWGMVAYASWHEVSLADTARAAARDGSFLTAEGCLSTFHPGKPWGSKTIDADETWTLGGQPFEYGTGGVGFAWKLVEPLGGAVHADSRVKVAFVRNEAYGRNEILRLIVQPHACPRAPDPGPPG